MKNKERLMIGVCFAIVIFSLTFVLTTSAQELRYETNFNETRLGVQYRINGIWATQFDGLIEEINETCIRVTWFKYDETTSTRIGYFKTDHATNYLIELKTGFIYYNETGEVRTFGEFWVYWFVDGNIVDTDNDAGELVIRDISGIKRGYGQIEKIRKYEYKVIDK